MRRATPDDLAVVNSLLAEFGREATADDLRREDLHVVITRDNMAMGAIYFSRDVGRWTAHTTSMVVHPDARGNSLGLLILNEFSRIAKQFAKEHGPLRMFGYSNASRHASARLLERAGWKRIGTATDEHGSHLWAVDFE